MTSNPTEATREGVVDEPWTLCPDLRVAVTDGKGGVTFSLNGHGIPAGIDLYHIAYVNELKADRDSWREQASERVKDWDDMRKEADALRSEVSRLRDECADLVTKWRERAKRNEIKADRPNQSSDMTNWHQGMDEGISDCADELSAILKASTP